MSKRGILRWERWADARDGRGREEDREPIEAADGTPDPGYLRPEPLGPDLLEPATWLSLACHAARCEVP